MFHPFVVKMASKKIRFEFKNLFNENDYFKNGHSLNRNLCTDFKLYESVFFHLMQNAIKYSPKESVITVECFYQQPADYSDLNGYLVTRIVD